MISDQWLQVLDMEYAEKILDNIEDCFPPKDKVFEFARLTPFENISIVIIGQDPYPTPGHAHGLSFSCLGGIPGSLRNIYKCLEKHKLISKIPESGDLTSWARQGVLLLNRSLTIGKNKEPHFDLWSEYTQQLIKKLDEKKPGLTYLLWGRKAEEIRTSGIRKVYIHPSPMNGNAFRDCPHFAECDWIDWDSINLAKKKTYMFTDGSCIPNNNSPKSRGGAAVYIPREKKVIKKALELESARTNIRAEGEALIIALKEVDPEKRNIIYTDSKFWIDMLFTYKISGWSDEKIAEKKNPDLVIILRDLWNKQKNYTEIRHVRSHQQKGKTKKEQFEIDGNNFVDVKANEAREMEPGKQVTEFIE